MWCEYCSLSFQSFVLCHVVIAPISITKKPQGSQHPTKRVNLYLTWFLLSPTSISFYSMLLFRSPHFKRAVVCPLHPKQKSLKMIENDHIRPISLQWSGCGDHGRKYTSKTLMIYPAHHKYFSSRSQSICGRRKFYPASNCPSATSCLGYPPNGSVRLLLCVFSILRAINLIGQYSLM